MKKYNLYLWVIVLLSMTLGFLIGSNQQLVQNVSRGKSSGNQKINQFINYFLDIFMLAIVIEIIDLELVKF